MTWHRALRTLRSWLPLSSILPTIVRNHPGDRHMIPLRPAAMLTLTLLAAGPASAASCGSTEAGFDQWLSSVKQQAVKSGISPRTAESALSDVSYDPRVIRLDRSQKPFK